MERIRELENELDKAKAANERNKSERNREALTPDEVDRIIRDNDEAWAKFDKEQREAREDVEAERDELQRKLDAAEWLGDVPDKPEVKLGAQTATVGGNIYNVYNHTAKGLRAEAWELLALADAIDAEEAKRNDDQRIEEQAKALANTVHDDPWKWDNIDERRRENYRAAIRAGWVKEDDK